MPFEKGKSGNPAGRPSLPAETRAQVKENSVLGVQRMNDLLRDDSAWGADGWLPGKDQIALANTAIDRTAGRAAVVEVQHSHDGQVTLDVSKRLADMAKHLPERVSQQRAIDQAIDVTPEYDPN